MKTIPIPQPNKKYEEDVNKWFIKCSSPIANEPIKK